MENDKKKRVRKQATRLPAKPHIAQRLWEVERKSMPQVAKVALGFIVAIILTILLIPNLRISQPDYKVGDIATRDIKASADYLLKDVKATERRIEAAKKDVSTVFDLDSKILSEISLKLNDAFAQVHALEENAPKGKSVKNSAKLRARRAEVFRERLGVKVSDNTIRMLERNKYQPKIAEHIINVMRVVLNRGMVSDDREHLLASANGIVIRDLETGEAKSVTDTDSILDSSTLEPFLQKAISRLVPEKPNEIKIIVRSLTLEFVRPNLVVNLAETQTRIQRAVDEVKPVNFELKKGESIIRAGDPITEEKLMKLLGLAPAMSGIKMAYTWLGLLVLVVTILYLGWIYLSKFKHWVINNNEQLILLSAIFVGNMLIIKAAIYFAGSMAESQGIILQTSFYYAIPFAIGAMLAAILFDMEIAILFSVATFILAGVLIRDNISYPLLALVGSLVASFRGKQYRQRSTLLLTGVFVGLGSLAIVVSADLINNTLFTARGGFDALMGFVGGIMVGIIVSGILPIFESLFNMATDIKLLELSDPNHPLLRELVVQAPGTYHHSVVVGSLAEEAAKNVMANDLFARVASYYHDVGKIYKPEYFIENQQDSVNRHDKLSPSMSGLILISHIKDGAELGREHKLPPAIIDIVKQHHGTSLISFFYNKAKEQNNKSHQEVDENDFRYHGPKPQGKEAAIVMLADSVEAAARTLGNPTPARLNNVVQRIVNHNFIDGQLDECDLSLKDLHIIVDSFVRILAAIFHQRITYPQQEEGVEEIPQSVPEFDFGGKQTKPEQSKN